MEVECVALSFFNVSSGKSWQNALSYGTLRCIFPYIFPSQVNSKLSIPASYRANSELQILLWHIHVLRVENIKNAYIFPAFFLGFRVFLNKH